MKVRAVFPQYASECSSPDIFNTASTRYLKMGTWSISLCFILVSPVLLHFAVGNKVISDNCEKVLRQEHQTIQKAKNEENISNLRYQVCYKTPSVTYYCPGDTICCTPGSPNSKCCPEDRPLCLQGGFCCPTGYPKICGPYCCPEGSYCCGENCCKIEKTNSCDGKTGCTDENPCCTNGGSGKCCNKNTKACCDGGYGCVEPCPSQFDAIGCELELFKAPEDALEEERPVRTLQTKFKFLYRILRPDEKVAGLFAKNPLAKKTVLSHVNCGSRPNYISQYISTTDSLEVARYYMKMGEKKGLQGLRIGEIDVSQLPKGTIITDLTTEANRDRYLGNAVCKNFAKKSQEVLLQSDKPIPCKVIEEEKHDGGARNDFLEL